MGLLMDNSPHGQPRLLMDNSPHGQLPSWTTPLMDNSPHGQLPSWTTPAPHGQLPSWTTPLAVMIFVTTISSLLYDYANQPKISNFGRGILAWYRKQPELRGIASCGLKTFRWQSSLNQWTLHLSYTSQVRGRGYTSQVRGRGYTSQVRGRGYTSQVRGRGYTSQVKGRGYTSQVRGRGYTSQVRGRGYTSQVRGRGYTSQVRGRGYTSQVRGRGYTSQVRGRGLNACKTLCLSYLFSFLFLPLPPSLLPLPPVFPPSIPPTTSLLSPCSLLTFESCAQHSTCGPRPLACPATAEREHKLTYTHSNSLIHTRAHDDIIVIAQCSDDDIVMCS